MARASGPPDGGAPDRAKAMALVPVSRETEERLACYVALLHRWQQIKNLVGPATLDTVWTRHIADSAQLVAIEPEARRWVDLGSGAGFPGLVVAILLHDLPGARVDLVESNERKAAFLREAVRATGAPARVHRGRSEAMLPLIDGAVDVVTARALAPLPVLVAMSEPLLRGGAVGLFLKGADEVAGLGAMPGVEILPSLTHPAGRIVRVRSRQGGALGVE